jgi:hypothetical protein
MDTLLGKHTLGSLGLLASASLDLTGRSGQPRSSLELLVVVGWVAHGVTPLGNAGAAAGYRSMFSRSIPQYRALYADTSVEILTLVSRDLVL